MSGLTQNERSFVEGMRNRAGDDLAWAFRELSAQPAPERFFMALKDAGHFDPVHCPRVEPEAPGGYLIPFWPALGFLAKCAERSSDLAPQIIEIVRGVTFYKDEHGDPIGNPAVFSQVADIFATLPVELTEPNDAEMARIWLGSQSGHSPTLGDVLSRIAERLFSANIESVQHTGLGFLLNAMEFKADSAGSGGISPLLDGFWLERLVNDNAANAGAVLGRPAGAALLEHLRRVATEGRWNDASWSIRAAVEESDQNFQWLPLENASVVALRDAFLGWVDACDTAAERDDALRFCRNLIADPAGIVRRIGIFAVSERWDKLATLYSEIAKASFFTLEHKHELYQLLTRRFATMTQEGKSATVAAISRIHLSSLDGTRDLQRAYLEALPPQFPAAATLRQSLGAEGFVSAGRHPEFNAFTEFRVGPGASPYTPAQLVGFVLDGSLVERLATPLPEAGFHGPTKAGLVSALEQAVIAAPSAFVDALPAILAASSAHQACVVRALNQLWKRPEQTKDLDWPRAWPKLFDYFEEIVNASDQGGDADLSWLLAAVADFLQETTRDDSRAYPSEFLQRGWQILGRLACLTSSTQLPGARDPVNHAINTPHGRVVAALVVQALRMCRLADATGGAHAAKWDELRPTFEAELAKAARGNLEFSTLIPLYAPNVLYLSPLWLRENVPKLFPKDRPEHLECAFAGLGYAQYHAGVYRILREYGVIEAGLSFRMPPMREEDVIVGGVAFPQKRDDPQNPVVRWIAQTYLLGAEPLDSTLMTVLFRQDKLAELQAATWFLGTAKRASPNDAVKQRVAKFALKCAASYAQNQNCPAMIQALARLIWALPDANGANGELLALVAPAAARNAAAFDFANDLLRLAATSPKEVGQAFEVFARNYVSAFDFKDHLKELIRLLWQQGETEAATKACQFLRNVPGMRELYAELSSGNG